MKLCYAMYLYQLMSNRVAQMQQVQEEALELFRRKNTDYGDSFATIYKLNPAGELTWSQTWFGDGYNCCDGVAINNWGHIYLGGRFYSTIDFDPGDGVNEKKQIDARECDKYNQSDIKCLFHSSVGIAVVEMVGWGRHLGGSSYYI